MLPEADPTVVNVRSVKLILPVPPSVPNPGHAPVRVRSSPSWTTLTVQEATKVTSTDQSPLRLIGSAAFWTPTAVPLPARPPHDAPIGVSAPSDPTWSRSLHATRPRRVR